MPKAATHAHKVAVYIPDFAGGGGERAMLKLAGGLAERGYSVDFLVANAVGPYANQVPGNVHVVDLKAGQPRSSVPMLRDYLRRERPRAMVSSLHTANIAALWANRLAGTGTRLVLSIQNAFSVEFQGPQSRRRRLMHFCALRFYHWAGAIVAVSQGVADDLASALRIPRSRVCVIYNPVISEELLARSKEPVEHPWLQPGQPPVILAVGRLHPQKNYPDLLQAFAQVRAQRDARLLILGEGEERAQLEALTCQLGLSEDVQMPGFVTNPYAYMRHAALLALSSKWEGLPTVLIEALACGTPVVSTDCPSGPREILVDGRYGALAPMGDVTALACAMLKTLQQTGQTPPEESWRPFTVDGSVAAYLALIEEEST